MTDPKLDYTSRVYSALKDNLQGFDKTPAQFLDSMQDSDYRNRVYAALKDNLQGFDKTQDEFNNLVVPQKKNSGTSVPSQYVAAPEQDDSAPSSSQSGSAAQSTAFDPKTFMRQSRANVLNQPAQDNTLAVQPQQTKIAIDSQLHKEEYQQRKKEIAKEAVINSTAQYLKNKGINAPVGSAQFNQQLAKTQSLVDKGEATVSIAPDGQAGLKRNTGFLENIKNGWDEATKSAEEANDFVNNMTNEQRVEYVNKHDIKPLDQFIGEKPTTFGSLGHFMGGAAPFLGKAAVGAGIGALAVAAAPESMGASLAGLPTAMSFILTAPDMANQGAQQEIIRRYQILKSQNPQMSDSEAMDQADKGALAGGIGGILTNAALMGTGLKTPVSLEAKGVLGKTLQQVVKSGVHMGAISAGITGAQELESEAEGIHTSTSDKLKDIANSFKDNATTGLLLTTLTHGIPKILQSAVKYGLKDTPPQEIRNVLQANENAGVVPPNTTEKIMSDLNGYNEALNKTVDGLSPEATASVAGLIQKKNNLIAESKTKDDSFKPIYKEKIDAIDQQIQDIQRTGKPFEHEIDDVTGKPYQQPTYDEVAQQKVQELAQKIAKGKPVSDQADLQVQQNFPKELKGELQKHLQEDQKAGKEGTAVQDNINTFLKQNSPTIASAIIEINGKTYEGKNHAEAILKAKADGQDISQVDRQGEGKFKLSDGTIIDRAEAKKRFGQDKAELLIPQDEAAKQADKDYKKYSNPAGSDGETATVGKPAEPVSSPVISDLTGSDVIMNGERGKLKTDEENNVLFDNGTKETLLGKTTDEKFNNSDASEYGIKPAPKVEVKGDNVNIDGEGFTLKPNGESFNKDNNGNLVSVTLINKKGEERTMRNKDLALDVAIAKNQHDFESKPEPTDYEVHQQVVNEVAKKSLGQKANDIIDSMPEEVADTFAAMDNKIEAIAPEETQQMVIRSSEWADEARQKIKESDSSEKEKADAIKMLDKFGKDLNKYYGKLEKQRKSQADADVKRGQAESLATAKQRAKTAREKAKQLELEAVEQENLATSLESRNRTYKLVNEIDEPTDARGIALQYFAGGNKVDSGEMANEVTGKRKTSMNRTGKTSDSNGNTMFEKNGRTVDEIAHSLWDNLPEHIQDGITTQDIRNELLDVMGSHGSRFDAAKEYVENYHPDYIQAKREKEDYDHYYAEHLKEVEAEEKWLQDEANKQKEFEESPEYIQQLINESSTTSRDAETANTGSKEERNTPVGSKTSDAESGSNPKRPSEDNRSAEESQQQSDKGERVGKYEAKARKVVENLNKKVSELPSWIINTDSSLKSGADASTLLKIIGDATITVGKALDKGVELKDAIAEGTKELLDKLRKAHGVDKLDPEFEKQVKEGFSKDAESKFKEEQYTSIKNRIVDEEREQQGKEPLKSSGDGTMAQFEKTKARIESGEIPEEHIRDLTAALATGFDDFSTNLSATEMHHALLYDRNTLQRKSAEIDKGLLEAREKGDKKAEAMWMGKRAQNEVLLENNDLAARRLGREWSDVGRARQLLIKQDYTLEALTRKYKAANGGDIPEHVKDKLRKLSKEIESKDLSIQEMQKKQAEAEKEINDLKLLIEAEKENRRANMKPEDALNDLKKEVKSQVRAQGKRTIEKIKFERENIKASLKNKWKNHIKGGSAGMNNIIPLDMVPDLIKLAKSYIEEGLAVGKEVVLEKLIDRVHKDVVDALENPEIDKTTVRDAITGYGKIKKPNIDPVETAFRDLTAQGRLVSSIELANKGENPLKSGAQRDKPTPEQRRLQKELNKAIKDNNIQVKSPEEQIKTSLDAAKTRLKNQIEDLTDAIDRNEKIVKDRKGIEYDQEANDLKVQRDKLREQYDEIFGTNKELTDEDRIERATKAVQKSIDKLNERIANKDFSQNKKVDLKSPELDALKKQREDLQKVYKDLMEAEGETNRRKLEAMKKHLIKRTAYLNEIKNTGNLDKLLADRVKKKTILDAEALKLRAEQQKVKNDVDNMIAIREFNNMGTIGKAIHWGNRFANGVLISNPAILARILGSVIGRATMKAPTEVVKYGLSKLPFAKGAYTEAIRTRHDLAEHIATYYSTLFSKENFEGMKFAFKHHNTKEDLTLGRNYKKLPIPDAKPGIKNYIQNSFFWTLKALDKNASLHGAGKSLASLPEYRAYQKTIGANLIREGVSPEELGHANLQEAINQLAFRKSLRAKFMQDNFITGLQGSMEEFLRRKGMPNGAELVKGIAPITKISSNYISEAITKLPVVGMVAAYKPIFKIFANALGKDSPLSENEKSVLLRTLTYQGVGTLTYALGYSLHSHFNPFYQSSARKYAQNKEGDEESGWMKLYETLSHFPDALVFNAGVSHGWVWDKYDEENPGEASMYTFMGSLPDALAENARSIGSSSPYLQSANTVINPLVTGKGLGKAAANFIKSRMPFSTTLNELAQGQIPVLNKFGVESGHEEKVKPYEVGIYPKTFMDNIKIGVPGWRQEVLKRLLEEKDAKKPRKTNQEKHDAKVRAHEKKIKEAEFEQQLNE